MFLESFAVSAPNLLIGWAAGIAAGFWLAVMYCWPLRKQVQALADVSWRDPLTKLANGAYFRSDVAELQRNANLAVMYIRVHRFDRQELSARRTTDLRGAARVLNTALPRCADRLYRMQTAGVQFGAVIANGDELIASRLAPLIISRMRGEGLFATIAIASSERLGFCDLALAAELRCQVAVDQSLGSWCLATETPPRTPRSVPLSTDYPEQLCAPYAVPS